MNSLHRQEFQCFEHESGGQIISQKDLEVIGCPHCEIERLRKIEKAVHGLRWDNRGLFLAGMQELKDSVGRDQ